MTKTETINLMSNFLLDKSIKCGIPLKGINHINYSSFLDRSFKDGGKVRKKLLELAAGYNSKGKLTKTEEMEECLQGVIAKINKFETRGLFKGEFYN